MESSILSEVDDTSILRTGLSTPLSLSSQPATASRLLPPRSGLERSDFVLWPDAEVSERLDDFRFRACLARLSRRVATRNNLSGYAGSNLNAD